jgi:hypothetical protein
MRAVFCDLCGKEVDDVSMTIQSRGFEGLRWVSNATDICDECFPQVADGIATVLYVATRKPEDFEGVILQMPRKYLDKVRKDKERAHRDRVKRVRRSA